MGGGGSPLHKLCRSVRRQRIEFLHRFGLKLDRDLDILV